MRRAPQYRPALRLLRKQPLSSAAPRPVLHLAVYRGAAGALLAALFAALPGIAAANDARRDEAAREPSLEIVVERRQTLIGLSREWLDPPEAWPEVARINRLRDPDLLLPGQTLRIPLRLLRSQPAAARLLTVNGDVRVAGQPARAGDGVAEGQALETGPGSSAVLELPDASRVKVAPSSLAEIAASRHYLAPARTGAATSAPARADGTNWFVGALRMLQGSVEVFATEVLRIKPLEVKTPTAVVGVRGTQYRVHHDEAANRRTNAEVLVGAVRLEAGNTDAGANLAAGFGAALEQGARAPRVARLSDAPDLSGIAPRFERPLVRFTVPGGTGALRVQVSPDPSFDALVFDQRVAAGTEVRIADLPDAAWMLRVRRIDALGIEGYDAVRPFVLKARPEPPASTQPRRASKQTVGSVAFGWTEHPEAGSYRLQVARDAQFKELVLDRERIERPELQHDFAEAGVYHWRLASTRADGDRGPFGDPLSFELRPMPEPPKGGLAEGGDKLVFAWGGREVDRHQVELAHDPQFADIVARAELAAPEWVLPKPARAGEYYFRYRSIEPDGFVGPYSSPLKTEVPRDWSFLWLLLPLLFVL